MKNNKKVLNVRNSEIVKREREKIRKLNAKEFKEIQRMEREDTKRILDDIAI